MFAHQVIEPCTSLLQHHSFAVACEKNHHQSACHALCTKTHTASLLDHTEKKLHVQQVKQTIIVGYDIIRTQSQIVGRKISVIFRFC